MAPNAKNHGEASASVAANAAAITSSGGSNGNSGNNGTTTTTTNDWEGKREIISNLYRDQNKTLKETMQIMADTHGFFAR